MQAAAAILRPGAGRHQSGWPARCRRIPSRGPLSFAAALALACLLLAPAAVAAPSIAGTRSEIAELGRQVAELDVQAGAAAAAHNVAIDRLETARRTLA